MRNNLPLAERSISQLYLDESQPRRYTIPIYQRNYAWGEEQIEALISDVYNAMMKQSNSTYYIGTLVTYKRGESDYEIIDGQQRLTTIYLILRSLSVEPRNELTYTARSVSAAALRNLPNLEQVLDAGIKDGYNNALRALRIVEDSQKENFKNYFLHNVHIIHYDVPKDVDLNHYFEIMNSRGEQLEMHEIVKSLLCQPLSNENEMALFNDLWSACSEMNVYIQQKLQDKSIFFQRLDSFIIKSFEDISSSNQANQKAEILSLMKGSVDKVNSEGDISQNDKFLPVIDFPNFLLIVLKLTLVRQGRGELFGTLDDKELLKEFGNVLSGFANDKERAEFSKLFVFNLLKSKYLLDNYIVHHDMDENERVGENPWKLEYYFKENSSKSYYKNLSPSQDKDEQRELVHILSMFEVTFSAKQRKNYLFYCLMYLFDNFSGAKYATRYLEFLRKLADKYFYDIYLNSEALGASNQPKPNAFDEIIIPSGELSLEVMDLRNAEDFNQIFPKGSMAVPLYVFNYTDYRLWKKYCKELREQDVRKGASVRVKFFEDLGCSDFELEVFNNFYFSRTRKSLEHYYPQAKAIPGSEDTDSALSQQTINCFGNFAMIGAEANSSGSNWDPRTKQTHYADRKSDPVSVASLKFKIMMQKCRDNELSQTRTAGMEWDGEDIDQHQKKILGVLWSE